MNSWCSIDEVDARVQATPAEELLQEFADAATSLLFELSGRKFSGSGDVISYHEVNKRGYVILTMWAPVNDVTDVLVQGISVAEFNLSPAGTYLALPRVYAGQTARLTMNVGQNPPVSGRTAAAALAADMLRGDPRYTTLAALDDTIDDGRPDGRLTSISRQGVTYTYKDLGALAEKNQTGIYEVDLFLRAVNPNGTRHQPKVVMV